MSEKETLLNVEVTITTRDLITIMENAFIDGWKTRDDDWIGPEDYLRLHKEYGDSSETTTAIEHLLNRGRGGL